MPWRVLFVSEIFSKFVVSLGSAPYDDIFYESVFAVLKWKCGSFLRIKGERIALISCVAMWLCTICAYTHTIQVWGIVAFIPI